MTAKAIDSFRGEYRFLSNFYIHTNSGHSVEHFYQAAKTDDPSWKSHILLCQTPGQCKRLGRQAPLRSTWESDEKLLVMRTLLIEKFTTYRDLGNQLVATLDAPLVEGNNWGDRFWGVDGGRGENHLGRILMGVREVVREIIIVSEAENR